MQMPVVQLMPPPQGPESLTALLAPLASGGVQPSSPAKLHTGGGPLGGGATQTHTPGDAWVVSPLAQPPAGPMPLPVVVAVAQPLLTAPNPVGAGVTQVLESLPVLPVAATTELMPSSPEGSMTVTGLSSAYG